jgi:prepilin-type processing-associated H-X9-DG protein
MHCPKCGHENPDNAPVCSSCGSELPKALKSNDVPATKVSGLTIAAFVLGILSLFSCGLTAIPAIVLGIVSFVIIEKSGGKLTGTNFSVLGFVIPVCVCAVLGILLPALLHARNTDSRMACGANLSEIGKAMFLYANDNNDELPCSGGKDCIWRKHIANWRADNRFGAYELKPDGTGGVGNISSCFYLLVKYGRVSPKSFVCNGDKGATEFNPSDDAAGNKNLADFWDFGIEPSTHCSYSYHQPFSMFPLTTSSEPGMAVAADRNPWIDSPGAKAKQWPFFANAFNITKEEIRSLNAITHQEDGQNVLFVDGHVGFEKKSFCGVNDDNIYTFWNGGDMRIGGCPWVWSRAMRASVPMGKLDSLLVHDAP